MSVDTQSRIVTLAAAIGALALVAIAVATVGIAVAVTQYVEATDSAWTAPWVNTIEHGSWSVPEAPATPAEAQP